MDKMNKNDCIRYCESAILSEYDPNRGESPFDYGKISARVCK